MTEKKRQKRLSKVSNLNMKFVKKILLGKIFERCGNKLGRR